MHGDVKPENILYKHENDKVKIALTDFEFSGKRIGGTPLFTSPEGEFDGTFYKKKYFPIQDYGIQWWSFPTSIRLVLRY